jgi:hypothetical protein
MGHWGKKAMGLGRDLVMACLLSLERSGEAVPTGREELMCSALTNGINFWEKFNTPCE